MKVEKNMVSRFLNEILHNLVISYSKIQMIWIGMIKWR